jgi:hypothetical protein
MGTQTGAMGAAPGRERRRALGLLLLAAVAATLLTATPAQATFHLMKVREIHTGGASGGSYVELQMLSGSQNFVSGHPIVVYNPNGTVAHTFTFSTSVANGQNQATILVAGPGYATAFPSGPAPDAIDGGLNLPATGGAVCFTEAEPPDCVSWGNFTGAASLPSATGTPASGAGVTAGKALHRSIAAGCATLLEPGDDTNDSAADFSEQNPNPRSNSSTIVEGPCPTPPNTTIGEKPANPTKSSSAKFTFTASPATGATFECKLDAEPGFTACTSPKEYTGLTEATHKFEVRAKSSAGTDPTPATYSWKISSAAPPETTIQSAPPNPSESASASFTYASNEAGASFECRLDAAAFAPCPAAGISYSGLANGAHSFQVRAVKDGLTDATPAGYSWDVAVPPSQPPVLAPPAPSPLPLAVTPTVVPDTILTLEPRGATRDRTPSFRFRSNVSAASFACKLDGGPFRPCSSPFTTKRLSFGPHTMQVRAAAGGAVDPTPARSKFKVVKPKRKPRR